MKTRTKATGEFSIALVTAPDLKAARKLAKIILQQQLAACANLVPKIESRRWFIWLWLSSYPLGHMTRL